MKGNGERFRNRAKVGKRWEHHVAEVLRSHGIDAVVPEEKSTFDKPRKHYTENDVDILVNPDSDNPIIIEVKSRRNTCPFTSPEDWPFDDVFVDTHKGWSEKNHKPDYYVFTSQVTGAIVTIDPSNRKGWVMRKIFDRDYGYPTKTLIAPKEQLHSLEWLIEKLKSG